jgi:hypothetical protein
VFNNPKIRFPVLEGDKLMKEVLNGGYNVHPVPPPNSEIKERIRKRYERKRIKIEKLLTLGYTTLFIFSVRTPSANLFHLPSDQHINWIFHFFFLLLFQFLIIKFLIYKGKTIFNS